MKKSRSAFSLIEVIFVLMILGIVASISSSILVQVYENYITQRALYTVTTKTEMVSNQIVNRLTYRIQGTTIVKDPSSVGVVEGTDWIMLKDIPKSDNNFTTIEWIGYDNDSFAASAIPGWSGVANDPTATASSMQTPGSQLSLSSTIINNLSNGEVDLNTKPAAIIFSEQNNYYTDVSEYAPTCMGLVNPANTACIFKVLRNGDENLTFPDANPKIVTERYKLAWSAYALVPVLKSNGLYDVYLHYNYQPWNNESYKDASTKKSLLMTNISVFEFTENGGVIQFKICASEDIGQTYKIRTCKEKAIIR